jgi:hypothetical protein
MVTASKSKPVAKKATKAPSVKAPPKKKATIRRTHLADEKYTGSEPQWDTELALKMTDEEFDHHLRRSFYFYNYHFTVKDLKPEFVKWLQEQKHFEVNKADLSKIIKSRWVPMTACSLVMAHNVGMPLRGRTLEYLKNSVQEVCLKYDYYKEGDDEQPEQVTPAQVKVSTIQDRLNERTSELLGELEGHYDEVCEGKTAFDHYKFLVSNNVVQGQLIKYESLYMTRKVELDAAYNGMDADLVEAYKHYRAADWKRIFAWLDGLFTAIEQYRGVKKASKKARVKKAPSKEKLVSKLKYCKDFPQLKIVSINPAEIVGAQELWVYNTKTRKLGKYIASNSDGFVVKGTTIENFTDKSVSKTLRKPEQQLLEFTKSNKVQLRKFLESIKATETQLNGRINTDTVLLRTQ